GMEFLGLQGHLVLLEVPSPAVELHHPGNTGELSFDDKILYGPELHGTVAVLIARSDIQDVSIDFPQPGGYGPHFGGPETLEDLFGVGLYLCGHELTGEVGPHAVLEDDRHHGKSKFGNRTDFLDPREVGHFQLDRIGDELFHVLGGQAVGGGDHLHLVVGDVGDRPNGDPGQGVQSDQYDKKGK